MIKYLFTFIILLSCVACNKEDVESKIDAIFSEFNNNSPGAAIAVVKNKSILFQKGFGLANLKSKAAIKPESNFRLASITKQFTALSILILEDEGKLSLSDKIVKFFPELKHYGKDISVMNILQHTSGLLDYEHYINDKETVQLKDKDVLGILENQDSTYFNHGSKHQYSNSGYAILALLIERVSGLTFAEFLRQKIFQPLNMNNTIAYENGISVVKDRVFGYTKTDSGFVDTDQSLTSAILGDGGIYSSLIDLIKWNKEVESPTILSKEKFSRVFKKGKTNDGDEFDYGFGWRLDPYQNYTRHYHTGGTSGFTNIFMKLPERDLTVIVLINLYDCNAKDYAEKVAELFIN